jgi:CheY-like chemotaxis protein
MAKKILLADDSITIQKVVALTLASEDYDLAVVGDGVSAVEKAKEIQPDLIMADISMPGKNGYEVCSIVKADPELAHTPVLLLSGTFEPIDNEKAEEAGADGHVVKPFESEELVRKITELLARPARPAVRMEAPPVAKPAVEEKASLPEDIWEAGDFLGAAEEMEAPCEAPAFELKEEFHLEEPKPEEKGGFFDFGLEEGKPPAEAMPSFKIEAELEKKPAPEMPSFEIKEEEIAELTLEEPAFEPEELKPAEKAEIPFEAAVPPPLEEPAFEPEELKPAEKAEIPFEAAVPPPLEEPAFEPEGLKPAEKAEIPFEAAVPPPFIAEERPRVEAAREAPAEVTGLSREKLEEIVAKVAREVISEIAWEVVPELAEELIRAEILEKVKEAMGPKKKFKSSL